MNTDELIGSLVRDMRPVKRSSRPSVLFAQWIAFGLLYLAVGVFLIGTRNDLAQMWREPSFVVHTLIVFSVTVLAAFAAFKVSFPGREKGLLTASSVLALAAWLAWLVTSLLIASEPHAGLGWKCLRNIIVLALPLGLLTYSMMNRGAPLQTSTAGWLAALSAAAAADLATRFICRNDHAFHALTWHFIPVLVLGFTGVLVGRFVFRWAACSRVLRE